jgi:hypothetical protein
MNWMNGNLDKVQNKFNCNCGKKSLHGLYDDENNCIGNFCDECLTAYLLARLLNFEKIVSFVEDVYGENKQLSNSKLQEFGIDPVTKRPTKRALDAANVCRVINHFYVEGVCSQCGSIEPPRQ